MPFGPLHKAPSHYSRERDLGKIYSVLLHLLFLFFAVYGLPSFLTPPPPEDPPSISVEILPISEISNVKPSETPPAPDVKPEEKQPEQPKAAPPVKIADPAPAPPPPPPPPPPEKAIQKPKEPPPEIKKPAPKPEVKPEIKKEEKKPKPKPDDLATILKAVKETAQKEASKEKKADTQKPVQDTAPSKSISSKYNASMPMSMSEKDAIMSQLAKCWTVPAGAKDAQNLIVVIDAQYNIDGSYIKVALASESQSRYNSDTFFRAAADSALRAVKECSPIKNLPQEKYDTWKEMELRFDPKFMLN